jgi:hypothetical protein
VKKHWIWNWNWGSNWFFFEFLFGLLIGNPNPTGGGIGNHGQGDLTAHLPAGKYTTKSRFDPALSRGLD